FGKKDGWKHRGAGLPKNPLYRLPELASEPEKPVLLVEGEKACDAASEMFPDYVCICWLGGTGQLGKADFSPLAGRSVTYWQDADKSGAGSVPIVTEMLKAAGVKELRVVHPPSDLPRSWDLADPVPDGFNVSATLEAAHQID